MIKGYKTFVHSKKRTSKNFLKISTTNNASRYIVSNSWRMKGTDCLRKLCLKMLHAIFLWILILKSIIYKWANFLYFLKMRSITKICFWEKKLRKFLWNLQKIENCRNWDFFLWCSLNQQKSFQKSSVKIKIFLDQNKQNSQSV